MKFPGILIVLTLFLTANHACAEPQQLDVFTRGENGYNTYRIPAMIKTSSGTLLAFCEGRRDSSKDHGAIDLVLKRSTDNGATWGPLEKIWVDGDNTCGNPAPVVDKTTGRIWLFMTWNLGTDAEKMIHKGTSEDTRRVFVTYSDDDGMSWDEPLEVTNTVKQPNWRWYATGPCHGIQHSSGRLIIPGNHSVTSGTESITRSHAIVSDDHGKTWRHTEPVGPHTNESSIAEVEDGRVYINMRSYRGMNRRAVAWSDDRGNTWSGLTNDDQLIEPVCQASVLRHETTTGVVHLFSNPASIKREKMTVRLSTNNCESWNDGRIVWAGKAAYSDLCSLDESHIGLLYERELGTESYGRISLTTLPLSWLMETETEATSE